jgi:prepilin-type N-terminal cleavage/methylation domain-containing protein
MGCAVPFAGIFITNEGIDMKRFGNSRSNRQAGFTLVELLITVVIVGIIAAAAAPHFERAFERSSFNTAGRNISSTMRFARSLAISDKEPYGVIFDDETLSMTLFRDISAPGTYSFDGADSVIRVDTLPPEFKYIYTDCEGNTIVFGRSGQAHFRGFGNVYSMAETENIYGHYWVNVLAATGRVKSESYIY